MQVANIHIATLEGRHRIGENPCRAEKLEMREKFKMRGSWVFIFLELQCFSSKNKINGELRYEEIPLSSMVTEKRLNHGIKFRERP